MTRIKICGITEIEQAVAAAEAGADYLGLVFAPSSRRVIPQKAAQIVHEVKKLLFPPQIVGVFVNLPADDINFIAHSCGLDLVQLSGDENFEYCLNIEYPIIKTIHIHTRRTAVDIQAEIKKGYSYLPADRIMFLLDSKSKAAYGGTGQPFDWKLAAEVSRHYPVIVAGGLSPANIVQMLVQVKPWAVDVSSGVETGGKKDIEKIREFIRKVKTAR
jgi:phosphoribosylanthranilate isomerase